ncbi:MAG TPA: hypothetical protein VML96_03055, partial [Egibacteraceae bacterium]|nr:hypothetical protein [Egibacteraceae bacterium]
MWLQASAGAGAAEGSVGGVLMIAASVVVGLAAGLLCMLRWRMSGETRVLWIGCAIALFAGATVGVAGLLPAASGLGSGKTALLSSLRVASLIVVLALLVRGLTAPVVDSRLRPRTVLPPAIGVIAALTLALQLVLPDAVGSAADPRRQAYV